MGMIDPAMGYEKVQGTVNNYSCHGKVKKPVYGTNVNHIVNLV